jgi:hypothetical protein
VPQPELDHVDILTAPQHHITDGMKRIPLRLVIIGATLLLTLSNASPIAAAGQNNNNNNNNNNNDNNTPELSATPELDSLALFGTGAAGMAGYVLMRLRAGRRHDKNDD